MYEGCLKGRVPKNAVQPAQSAPRQLIPILLVFVLMLSPVWCCSPSVSIARALSWFPPSYSFIRWRTHPCCSQLSVRYFGWPCHFQVVLWHGQCPGLTNFWQSVFFFPFLDRSYTHLIWASLSEPSAPEQPRRQSPCLLLQHLDLSSIWTVRLSSCAVELNVFAGVLVRAEQCSLKLAQISFL